MTDWITQRAREAASTYAFCAENELAQDFATLLTEAYARGCVDQHERTRAAASICAYRKCMETRHVMLAHWVSDAIKKMGRPV